MTNLRKKNPNYDQVISHLPTMDVISSANIMNNSFQILQHRDFLFRFCMEFGFRKWRFKTKLFSQKSLVTLSKELTAGKDPNKVLIGFGDWTKPQGSPVKGRYGPVKKFRNELRNWAYVVVVDEFRTSKKCSNCESEEFDINYTR